MSYVPIVVPPPQPPSPRTRELADRMARLIVEFEGQYPTATRAEVREAARLALQATNRGSSVAPVAAVVLGTLALGAGIGVYFLSVEGGLERLPPPALLVASVIGLAAVLAVVFGRRP